MLAVGKFLKYLLKDHELPQKYSVQDTGISFFQPRYFCPDYSQMDIFCLMLGIFSDIPEAYQFMRCKSTTTLQQLERFLQRVKLNKVKKYKCDYLLMEVNKLSFKLQEVSLYYKQLYCKLSFS